MNKGMSKEFKKAIDAINPKDTMVLAWTKGEPEFTDSFLESLRYGLSKGLRVLIIPKVVLPEERKE